MGELLCSYISKKKILQTGHNLNNFTLSSTVLKEHRCNFGKNNSIMGCYLTLAMVSVGRFASFEAHCGEQYTEPLYYQGIHETINVFSAKSD